MRLGLDRADCGIGGNRSARYDLSCVVGVEQMKTVDSTTGGDYLGTAAWYEREAKESSSRSRNFWPAR